MKTKRYIYTILLIFALMLSGCTMPFGQPQGPDSGEEIDTSLEPQSPESGEDADNQGPDSGEDADNQGPDSGDEVETEIERQTPDSGEDEDNQGPDSGEDGDNQGPDSGDDVDEGVERQTPDSGEDEDNQGPDSGEDGDNQGPDSGDDIALSEDFRLRAKASCNRISDGSTCIEYIGNFWSEKNARMNCGEDSVFATKTCPRPAIGGCNIGNGTANEIITWHYNSGGDPYTEDVKPYAVKSCNALPGGKWIN